MVLSEQEYAAKVVLREPQDKQADFVELNLQYIDSLCTLGQYEIAGAVAEIFSTSEHPQADALSLLASARVSVRAEPHRTHEILCESNLRRLTGAALGNAHLIRAYAFLKLHDPVTMMKEMIVAKKHGATLEFPQVSITPHDNESQDVQLN